MSFETTLKITLTLHVPGDQHDGFKIHRFLRCANGASMGEVAISDVKVEKGVVVKDVRIRHANVYKKMLRDILGDRFKFKILWGHNNDKFNIGVYDTKIETKGYGCPAKREMRFHYFVCQNQKITLHMPCYGEYETERKLKPPEFDINNPHVWDDIKKTFFDNYKN